jgi:hypothetical protein
MALTAAALATALLVPAVAARPPAENMGCSQGSEWMIVGEGEADRLVPYLVDDPANGGNGDGIVCAHAIGDGKFHTYPDRPDTVYGWEDNWR